MVEAVDREAEEALAEGVDVPLALLVRILRLFPAAVREANDDAREASAVGPAAFPPLLRTPWEGAPPSLMAALVDADADDGPSVSAEGALGSLHLPAHHQRGVGAPKSLEGGLRGNKGGAWINR